MTDSPAPIEDRDANIRSLVAELLSEAYESLFTRYDKLHKRNINDDDIIRALRQNGDGAVADDYMEWSGAVDPDAEDDNTTMNPAVPDPGSAASYLEWTGQGTTIHLKNGEPRVTSAPAKVEVVWP